MRIPAVVVLTAACVAGPGLQFQAGAQTVTKDTVAGVRNFARLESTVACAGAINPAEAVPEIKKMGFASVINLRESTEAVANVEDEEEQSVRITRHRLRRAQRRIAEPVADPRPRVARPAPHR